MALTRRESMKLLGASMLASTVGAASAKKAEARPKGRPDDRRSVTLTGPTHTAAMKRLYALPILLDY
jgi:hypothetical protein